jgi:carotenoid cleavage dioxygenase-like enzyme
MNANAYQHGNFLPVTHETTAVDLEVRGAIPEELAGLYVRNGANPIASLSTGFHEWVGHGMVHGIRLDGGHAAWYRSRWVRTAEIAALLGECDIPGEVHLADFAANTHVVRVGDTLLATVEAGPRPVAFDARLGSIGRHDFAGTLPGAFAAHTKRDPATGKLHALTYAWPDEPARHLVIDASGRVERADELELNGPTCLHDFAITDSSVVVFDQPVLLDEELAVAGHPFPYRWADGYPARVGCFPIDGSPSETRWWDAPTGYVFHPANAFGRADGTVVVDVPRAERVFDRDLHGSLGDALPSFERWELRPGAAAASVTAIDERPQDFPRIHPQMIGRPYRYSYQLLLGPGIAYGQPIKHDVDTGRAQVWDLGDGVSANEPVFVPRVGATTEDDGYVMTFTFDASTGRSSFVILDATTVGRPPITEIGLPSRVPFGFHGDWFADDDAHDLAEEPAGD